MRTVIIDNYDSFTYNLYQYVGELDEAPLVVRNDEVTLEQLRQLQPDRIILSPGPGTPEDPAYFGVCREVILHLGPRVPLLGVCLGHQGIVHALGGQIVRAPVPTHGKTSLVYHQGQGLLAGLPSPLEAMRYHSLVAASDHLPSCLRATAHTADGLIMAIEHREFPIFGVQFHPESIGTALGKRLLVNFINPVPLPAAPASSDSPSQKS